MTRYQVYSIRKIAALLIPLMILASTFAGVQATVTTTTFSQTYTASGSTTAFTFNFPVINTAAVVVEVNGTVQTFGYTVTLNPVTVGGTVTFTTAPASGSTVLITRSTPLTQTSALTNEGVLPAATLEGMSDKLTEISQEIEAQVAQTGGGTVTSVAQLGDGILFNSIVSGSPITTGGTLQQTLLAQNPNTVFCNPTNGSAVPQFLQGTSNGTFLGMSGGVLGFYAPAASAGTVSSVGLVPDNVLYSAVTNSPVTTSGNLTPVLKTQSANTVFANATAGAALPSFVQGSTNGTFLGMQGGVLGFFTPPSVSGGTVSNVSTSSTPAWLTSTWANASTTPQQTIASATGLTSHQVLGTGSGSTLAVQSLTSADIPSIPLTTGVTGVLPITNGGTNNGSLPVTAGGVYYADGTRFQQVTGSGLLQLNGTSAPTVVAASSGNLLEATVTVTQSNFDNLNSSPLLVVAAPTGYSAVVDHATMIYTPGTAYTAGGNISLQYGTAGATITNLLGATTFKSAASATSWFFQPVPGSSVTTVTPNTGIYLFAAGSNYATGTGTAVLKVYYTLD